jgi:predicted nucleotidyltransferase
MEHAGSDLDLWRIYVADSREILTGTGNTRSRETKVQDFDSDDPLHYQNDKYYYRVDIVEHEAGSVVQQLLKGNLNYIVGVLSPFVRVTSLAFGHLRKITCRSIAKNCYHAIHGMAKHNYKKYVESGKDDSTHRCNKIMRVIQFGIRLLRGDPVAFKPAWNTYPEEIPAWIASLDYWHECSTLPDKPNPVPFYEWLLDVRLANLEAVKA